MRRLRFLIVVLSLGVAACDDDDLSNIPTTPDPRTTTFTGTLNRNDAETQLFDTARSGTVAARLTALTPDDTISIGVSLGTWNGNTCQILLAKDDTKLNGVLTGTVSNATTLCIRVYDVGAIVEPATYTIDVTRP
jgi:hypothetical protein